MEFLIWQEMFGSGLLTGMVKITMVNIYLKILKDQHLENGVLYVVARSPVIVNT